MLAGARRNGCTATSGGNLGPETTFGSLVESRSFLGSLCNGGLLTPGPTGEFEPFYDTPRIPYATDHKS
jgi:hypothetical protein